MTVRLDFYFPLPVNTLGEYMREPYKDRALIRLAAKNSRQARIIPVIMAGGFHLFPFRTQKLSLHAPMVLPGVPVGEWVVAGMIVACK